MAAQVPWADALVYDISRSGGGSAAVHIPADLADPASWVRLGQHFAATIIDRQPARAVFIHCAATLDPIGPAHDVDPDDYGLAVLLNSAAPQVLGAAFLRAVAAAATPIQATLVLISSGAATSVYEGWSAYGAAKAAVDQWVRTAGAEQDRLDHGVQVLSVAPGVVATGMQQMIRDTDPASFPQVDKFVQLHRQDELTSPADAAIGIWDVIQRTDVPSGCVLDLRTYDSDQPG